MLAFCGSCVCWAPQWKVHRTLAFFIHKLAMMLRDQLAAADLVHIFRGFLKDLDEVRMGVLKHLSDFQKVERRVKTKTNLPSSKQFFKTLAV